MTCERHKIPTSELQKFENTFLATCKKFGMLDWNITFHRGKPPEDCFALIHCDPLTRSATVMCNDSNDESEYGKFDAYNTGIHEAMHMLLATFEQLARRRDATNDDINQEIERLTVLFANVLADGKFIQLEKRTRAK